MTTKQRKALLICLGIVVASYIARSVVMTSLQMAYRQQAIREAQPRPKAPPNPAPPIPAAPTPVAVAPAITTPATTPSPAAKVFAGTWLGQSAIPGRGICTLHLEIREHPDAPETFSGFPKLTCASIPSLTSQDRAQRSATLMNIYDPETALLDGTAEDDSIHFAVVKVIGADSQGCALSSLTVSAYGINRIAAEWQEPTCSGGHLLLRRVPR